MGNAPKDDTGISAHRLHQAAWFVVSIVYALLIADVVKSGIVDIGFRLPRNALYLFVAVPTLMFLLLSAFEAFLWMKPEPDRSLSDREAVFKLVHLNVYFFAVVTQAYLVRLSYPAAKDAGFFISATKVMSKWMTCFALLMIIYSIYNIINFARSRYDRYFERTSKFSSYGNYILLYAVAGILFYFIGQVIGRSSDPYACGVLVCMTFVFYVTAYMAVWWRWHWGELKMLRPP